MLLWEMLTTPKGIVRPAHKQQQVDEETKNLVLYQFRTCPFCIRVRREIKRLSLNIEIRDARNDAHSREELLRGGGEIKVPCLKITDEEGNATWMYESTDINHYLHKRFGS
ncbi:MAG: glutaredoxin [Granulosicoccaceae bacterium]|jgi:glutaredoxin